MSNDDYRRAGAKNAEEMVRKTHFVQFCAEELDAPETNRRAYQDSFNEAIRVGQDDWLNRRQ